MAERMTASWTTAPHFYLVREVNVSRLATWRERASKQASARITYTDLLVKLVAAALARHPAVNTSWKDGAIVRHAEINIGLAVAIDDGLIVPVIHRADTLSLTEIATRREDVVTRGQAGKLRPADIQGGVFTISNLGMYGVDAFNAIVNPPQAAILAVGRIADRVVAVNGQPAVQPTMVLTLSCDHRALDGARAAQFLGTLADLIEEPLVLLGEPGCDELTVRALSREPCTRRWCTTGRRHHGGLGVLPDLDLPGGAGARVRADPAPGSAAPRVGEAAVPFAPTA